jgi:hypothetical protein
VNPVIRKPTVNIDVIRRLCEVRLPTGRTKFMAVEKRVLR